MAFTRMENNQLLVVPATVRSAKDLGFVAAKLANQEDGFVVSIELILTATIVVIGLIVGMTATRDAMLSELSDTAGAIQDLNQCFQFQGIVGHAARTCGSDFIDSRDFCDDADDEAGTLDNCILISAAFNDESARTRRDAAPAIGRARAAMAVLLERRRAAGGG